METTDSLPSTVAVIGLGLMGGSLARDLAKRGTRVLVHDARPEVASAVVSAGIASRTLDDTYAEIAAADLVVLATPVDVAVETLGLLRPYLSSHSIVTDVGSTKRAIVQRAEALGIGDRFVGSHPLAGDHRSGWQASRSGLYAGRTVFLCPTPSTMADALDSVRSVWSAVGARTELIDAAEHDRRMAWLSHLPQLMSSALAYTLMSAGWPAADLGPGGRDCTRLAASSAAMWTAICLENRDNLSVALRALEDRMAAVRIAIEEHDVHAVNAFFEEARRWSE